MPGILIFGHHWANDPRSARPGSDHIIINDSLVLPEPRRADMGPRQSLVRALGLHTEPVRWAFRKSDVAQVAFYFVGVVDGGADLQVAATFGTGANVNFKYSLEEFREDFSSRCATASIRWLTMVAPDKYVAVISGCPAASSQSEGSFRGPHWY